ncbi:Rap-GAP domain-containing protein [Aphelenchoides bicaudatus]|nr:Rap-GAP domain-containing protein [Aphelenchoides bicaudatus]
MSRDKKRTNTTINMPSTKQRNTSITSTSKESDDLLRRRHQSTKASTSSSVSPQKISRNTKELSQPPEEASGHITPSSDDVFLDCVEEKSPEWIQLVIRHVFGAESYVMRSFSEIPLDFDFDNALGCANNSDPTSLLLHLRGNHFAVRLLPRDNDLIARSLSFLDNMPSEEMHDVSVIYLREDNHTNMNDVLMTEYGSQRFISFVRRLGKPCKTDKTDFCYEHVDLLQKIRFHITTLIPCTTEAECQEKKKMIENSTICVVFNESGTPCKLSQLFRKNDQVALEVTPQDNSSVTINMHAIREVACWCALSRILLPDEQAVHVLRKMIVRMQRSYRMCTSINNEESAETLPYLGCTLERQRHVHKLRRHGVAEQF